MAKKVELILGKSRKPLYARRFQVVVKPSQPYLLEATLTDDEGSPLAGKTVDFYESRDMSTWTKIYSGTTDASGKTSVTVAKSAVGDYYYKARFEGDETYDASESNIEKVTVREEAVAAPAIPLFAIILVCLFLLLLFSREEEA